MSSLKIKLSFLFQMSTSGARVGEKQLLHVFYFCLWALETPHILLTTLPIFTLHPKIKNLALAADKISEEGKKNVKALAFSTPCNLSDKNIWPV